jgi:hypothetical protein
VPQPAGRDDRRLDAAPDGIEDPQGKYQSTPTRVLRNVTVLELLDVKRRSHNDGLDSLDPAAADAMLHRRLAP